MRHFYLSNNSLKFDGGDLGIDGDGDIVFTKPDDTVSKIATHAYVAANAGGSGSGGVAEKMILVAHDINLTNIHYPFWAFSTLKKADNGTFFNENYKIIKKTIQNTSTTTHFSNYTTTTFPPGDYKITWVVRGIPDFTPNQNFMNQYKDYLSNHGRFFQNALAAYHTLRSHKVNDIQLAQNRDANGYLVYFNVEAIFTITTQGPIPLWTESINSSANYLGERITFTDEYQEIEKLSSYVFDGSLTL